MRRRDRRELREYFVVETPSFVLTDADAPLFEFAAAFCPRVLLANLVCQGAAVLAYVVATPKVERRASAALAGARRDFATTQVAKLQRLEDAGDDDGDDDDEDDDDNEKEGRTVVVAGGAARDADVAALPLSGKNLAEQRAVVINAALVNNDAESATAVRIARCQTAAQSGARGARCDALASARSALSLSVSLEDRATIVRNHLASAAPLAPARLQAWRQQRSLLQDQLLSLLRTVLVVDDKVEPALFADLYDEQLARACFAAGSVDGVVALVPQRRAEFLAGRVVGAALFCSQSFDSVFSRCDSAQAV